MSCWPPSLPLPLLQAYAYPSVLSATRDILSRHGARGLYAGFGATLLRDAPEFAVQFAAYAQLKKLREAAGAASGATAGAGQDRGKANAGGGSGSSSLAEHMMLGGAAGAVAALATTPLDVVKTQLQCGAAPSVAAAVRHVLRTAGPAGLFNGLAPRLLQTTLCSAIFFTLFESSKAHLKSAAAAVAGAAVKGSRTGGAAAVAAAVAPVYVRVEPAAGAGWMYGRQQPYGAVWLWDACSQLPVCYHHGTYGCSQQQQAHEVLLGPAAVAAAGLAGRRAGPWARARRSSSGSSSGSSTDGHSGRAAVEVPAAALAALAALRILQCRTMPYVCSAVRCRTYAVPYDAVRWMGQDRPGNAGLAGRCCLPLPSLGSPALTFIQWCGTAEYRVR